jgi:Na+/H+ antiporter NhaD/arsenite permease-like protein
LGARLFKIRKLSDAEEIAAAKQHVAGFDENDGIESQGFFWFGAIMLVAFILVIATTSVLPVVSSLGMGYVALTFALIMLIRYKHEVEQFYKAVDWDLIGFFMALFVVIHMLEYAGVLDLIGQGITRIIGEDGNRFGVGALLVSSAAFSSVTDNIPLAAMLGKILAAQGTPGDSSLWWSVIFGANLGGNLTPIGSASTLVAVTIIHKHKLKLSFGGFVRKALPFAAMHIVLATIYVLVFF